MQATKTDTLLPTQPFSSVVLKSALIDNLATLGYKLMMPIQAESLPLMLKGEDVIAQAKTGSGKTAAFGLSVLNGLDIDKYEVQALILCPTRELAEQVCTSLRALARSIANIKILNLSGGIPIRVQLESMKHSPHIVVGTPGRVLKHLTIESLSPTQLKTVVLDEADRMLDMGFLDEISSIMKYCPEKRQTLLFSATFPAEIHKIATQFMQSPKKVIVQDEHSEIDIKQKFYEVRSEEKKLSLLKSLLLDLKPISTLVFCNTKQQTDTANTYLNKEGFSSTTLNGDLEQAERDGAIIRFKNHSCSILVATDVAARGLDIKELPVVINLDLAFDYETHIHRIGRTGRAGSNGLAISITTPSDGQRLCTIEDNSNKPICWGKDSDLNVSSSKIERPPMITFCLNAGRKNKVRAGDILGALTKDAGIAGDCIGKIDIGTVRSYVAVHYSVESTVFRYLAKGKIKGCKVHAKKII